MRKLKTLLAVVLTTLSLASFGQSNSGKVSGTVIDGSSKTIESATITLLRAKDSSVAKMSVADKTGKFVFDGRLRLWKQGICPELRPQRQTCRFYRQHSFWQLKNPLPSKA